ncbi:hypothetical protein BDV33DRAFT_163748 [Aspergillus novoparasiticus]|uniref:Uncharacterized protein n=1 Tax=Aspergillus novoparasiticus TaxID=986946 RepID=A0A5N6F7K7_9EURO|nr:hypothetical protein BDV33DRAFT_163748 [Aspergillus novoparasiticus]
MYVYYDLNPMAVPRSGQKVCVSEISPVQPIRTRKKETKPWCMSALVHALSGLFHLATKSCSCSSTGGVEPAALAFIFLFLYLFTDYCPVVMLV